MQTLCSQKHAKMCFLSLAVSLLICHGVSYLLFNATLSHRTLGANPEYYPPFKDEATEDKEGKAFIWTQ